MNWTELAVISGLITALLALVRFLRRPIRSLWTKRLRSRWRTFRDGKSYLDVDVPDFSLSIATQLMVERCAWAKWYAAQFLADGKPLAEWVLMQTAASEVHRALADGKLAARGRPRGQVGYVEIPRTDWRTFVLVAKADPIQLWRIWAVPGGSITEESFLQSPYDNLIIDPQAFVERWPRRHRLADKLRHQLLDKAYANAAPIDDILKLRRDED